MRPHPPSLRSRIGTLARLLAAVGILVVALTEIVLRLPGLPQPLAYRPDPVLVSALRPAQTGYVWLGNMSYRSPPITLNGDGHRGAETDWSRLPILAVGSSQALGVGVADREVWTAVLEDLLAARLGERVPVVNAAHPGFGPAQQAVVVERVLARHRVRALLVPVDVGDRQFRLPRGAELERAYRSALLRAKLKRATRALPFLLNKLQAQLPSIRRALRPWVFRREAVRTGYLSAATGEAMWREFGDSWARILGAASARDVPVVFVVIDALRTDSARVLEGRLRELARREGGARVVRIDGGQLGLRAAGPVRARAEYERTLTLGRDPHANARQHRLIAAALAPQLLRGELRPPGEGAP